MFLLYNESVLQTLNIKEFILSPVGLIPPQPNTMLLYVMGIVLSSLFGSYRDTVVERILRWHQGPISVHLLGIIPSPSVPW